MRPNIVVDSVGIFVTIDLVEARTGIRRRQTNVAGQWSDIVSFKRQLLSALTGLLEITLTSEESQSILDDGATNPESFKAILIGYGYVRRPGEKGYLDRALIEFQRAATIDSNSVQTEVLLSSAKIAKFGYTREAEWLDSSLDHVEKAIRMDSLRSASHVL